MNGRSVAEPAANIWRPGCANLTPVGAARTIVRLRLERSASNPHAVRASQQVYTPRQSPRLGRESRCRRATRFDAEARRARRTALEVELFGAAQRSFQPHLQKTMLWGRQSRLRRAGAERQMGGHGEQRGHGRASRTALHGTTDSRPRTQYRALVVLRALPHAVCSCHRDVHRSPAPPRPSASPGQESRRRDATRQVTRTTHAALRC